MNSKNNTKPDILRLTSIGKLGNSSGVKRVSSGRLTVTKGFNEPTNSIEIETIDGTFQRGQRETAFINITFADGQKWTGDFVVLQQELSAYAILKRIVQKNADYDDYSDDLLLASELVSSQSDTNKK